MQQTRTTPTNLALPAFIRAHHAEILAAWEELVSQLPFARGLERPALLDQVPDLLERIAAQADDRGCGRVPAKLVDLIEVHALERLDEGSDLVEVVAEYGLLRDCIIRLWAEQHPMSYDATVTCAIHQTIDAAIGSSVEHYTMARDRTLQSLDRISAAALETSTLDEFLSRLLQVLIETTAAVDTAAILLRDGDALRVRAAVGLDDRDIAALESAAADPHVISPNMRQRGVKTLHGTPLIESGELIGVAQMCSLTAPNFSKQDQRLFAAMANRAMSAIRMHLLREAADHRARQQQSIAALGMRALATGPLEELFDEVTASVKQTLAVEDAAIVEGKQLASEAVATEHELAVAIHMPEPARMFGALVALASERRVFSADEVAYTQSVAHILGMAIAVRALEAERRRTLEHEQARHAELEAARAEAERMLAVLDTVLAASAVGIGFIDTDLRYVRVNPALAALNGLAPELHIGRTIREVIGDVATNFLEPLLHRVLATREPVENLEFDGAPPSTPDQVRSFNANYVPVVTSNGVLLGIGAVVIDVTETKRRDAALRLSETRLHGIIEHAPAAIYVKDSDGRILLANRQIATLMGRPLEELIGRPDHELFPPKYIESVRASDQQVIATGTAIEVEDTVQLPSGTQTFLTVKFPLPGPNGERYVCGISTDISQRKAVELELRERELWFRSLADNIPQLAWMADETGSILWYNRRWYEFTGTTFEQMRGDGWRAVQHPEHIDRVAERFAHHVQSGEPWEDTFPMRGGDGRFRWFLSRAVPIRDEAGRVISWFGTSTDVSEQRFMHEAMAVLSSSLDHRQTLELVARLAVPALGDWCLMDVVDATGIVRVAVAHNDPTKVELARRLTVRYPRDWNASFGVPRVIRTGETEVVRDVDEQLLAKAGLDPEDHAIMRELGLKSAVIAPLVARDRTLGAITFATAESGRRYSAGDIATIEELGRRVGLAVDNARLFEEAQREARMREEILAIVSHDLKNPLGAIHLAATMLLGQAHPPLRKHLETIERAASRMDILIGDLLDVSTIQAGRLTVDRRPDDVEALLREVAEVHEPLAREKGITLEVCSGHAIRVLADHERVLQVLGNLIGNAIKFCRDGDTIAIRCTVRGAELEFGVADTGPGIPETELPHIFEPYWSARRYAKKGTGLGLSISKGIVDAHGGRLWVASRVGEGTTFYFTLPLA